VFELHSYPRQTVCSLSECQLRSSVSNRVIVTADKAGDYSSVIGLAVRGFPVGVLVDSERQVAVMLSHSYIAIIPAQFIATVS
jgi:hypothetical protein